MSKVSRVLFPSSSLAHEAIWAKYVSSIKRVVKERRYDAIDERLQKARDWINQLPEEDPAVVSRLAELADLYQNLGGDNLEAERLFRFALAEAEKRSAVPPLHKALPMNGLGLFLLQERRYEEAEQLFRRLLPLVEDEVGRESTEVASCLENLAAVLRHTGRLDEANSARSRAVKIRKSRRSR